MSQRGNCWGNAVAESFVSYLKRDRICECIHQTCDLARADVFDYIEVFTTAPGATVPLVALVPRPLKTPRYEAEKCLPERG